jgi:DNA-binding NtrC family response regulator
VRAAKVSSKLIFVVDAESALAEVLAIFLGKSGFAVAAFTSPVQALVAAASRKPDLLLSDYTMAEMDGLTLARKLTERHPTCKALIMSAAMDGAPTHSERNSFEFLQKPISLRRLLEKVAETLGE